MLFYVFKRRSRVMGRLKRLQRVRVEEEVPRIRTVLDRKGAVRLQGVRGLGVMKGKLK